MAAGGNIAKVKNFSNVVSPPLLTGNVTKKILEILNIPGLHIFLDSVDIVSHSFVIHIVIIYVSGFILIYPTKI